MIKIIEFPTLYRKTKTSAVQEWNLCVEKENDNLFLITTKWGQQNGKKQITFKKVTCGKNIGKANETSIEEQAISDANSMWEKKQLSNYRENLNDDITLLPMLAQKYNDKNKKKVKFPCYVQPKLDGVRCVAKCTENGIEFTSRKGKKYETLDHIEKELIKIMQPGEILDGEIFHPDLNFQEIVRRVKRVKADRFNIEDIKLQYWFYDAINEKMTFKERKQYLEILTIAYVGMKLNYLENVKTIKCNSEEDIKKNHAIFTSQGFEGTMIRNMESPYLIEHRSYDLLKLKDFNDAEFKIVGFAEGSGKDEGTIIFSVELAVGGNVFNVRPRGTHGQRSEWWENRQSLLGKYLTVRYQGFSEDGIPIFPVGISLRDYE